MQGIFQKENTDKALKYGIYRHLPTYEKIIRNLVSFYVKITLFFHYFSLLHRFRQRIEQRPPLWIQILFLIKCFFKKLCIFPLVIIRNMRVRIRNHIDLCMAGITLYCFDIR